MTALLGAFIALLMPGSSPQELTAGGKEFLHLLLTVDAFKHIQITISYPVEVLAEVGADAKKFNSFVTDVIQTANTAADKFSAAKTSQDKQNAIIQFRDNAENNFAQSFSTDQQRRIYQITLWSSGPGAFTTNTCGINYEKKLEKATYASVVNLRKEFFKEVNDLYDPRNMTLDSKGKPTEASKRLLNGKADEIYDRYDKQILLKIPDQVRKEWVQMRGQRFIIWEAVR